MRAIRLADCLLSEPLIVAVKRKGKASSSGVPGTLASKKTGKDKDSAPSGTEGPAGGLISVLPRSGAKRQPRFA